MKNNQKAFTIVEALIVIVAVVVICALSYVAYNAFTSKTDKIDTTTGTSATTSTAANLPSVPEIKVPADLGAASNTLDSVNLDTNDDQITELEAELNKF